MQSYYLLVLNKRIRPSPTENTARKISLLKKEKHLIKYTTIINILWQGKENPSPTKRRKYSPENTKCKQQDFLYVDSLVQHDAFYQQKSNVFYNT